MWRPTRQSDDRRLCPSTLFPEPNQWSSTRQATQTNLSNRRCPTRERRLTRSALNSHRCLSPHTSLTLRSQRRPILRMSRTRASSRGAKVRLTGFLELRRRPAQRCSRASGQFQYPQGRFSIACCGMIAPWGSTPILPIKNWLPSYRMRNDALTKTSVKPNSYVATPRELPKRATSGPKPVWGNRDHRQRQTSP